MYSREQLQNPDLQYRPDVRWWLAEGFHTDETLKKEIKDLFESGFGAIEFLAMEEPGADHSLYGWGAEEWIHDSDLIVSETAKYNMGVSMTCGTRSIRRSMVLFAGGVTLIMRMTPSLITRKPIGSIFTPVALPPP